VSGRLGDVVAVHTDGAIEKLDFPEQVQGVKGKLADLELTWMAGGGGNGVYVRARETSGAAAYVLHVASGKAELVAKQVSGRSTDSGCKEGYSVDAMKLPCRMPEALTYSSESLIMAGNAPFVLKIATK
jgi:hypothetical protein